MERATGSADRPGQFSSLAEWELTFDPSFHAADSDEIPEAAHPQEFHLYEEIGFALLTSENLLCIILSMVASDGTLIAVDIATLRMKSWFRGNP